MDTQNTQNLEPELKNCKKCLLDKPIKHFHRCKKAKYGRLHTCRACEYEMRKKREKENGLYEERKRKNKIRYNSDPNYRMRNRMSAIRYSTSTENTKKIRKQKQTRELKTNYNVEYTWYRQRLEDLNGTCELCKTNTYSITHKKALHLDHCHKTGKIRGFLCNNCNMALGLLKDDVEIIFRAAKYVKDGGIKDES